jgi:hypothetical protein
MARLRSPARSWLASLVAMALVGAVAPGVARAAWTAPVNLSGPGADSPQVAVDPQGNAIFTWEKFDGSNTRIQARRRSAAGVLSPIQTLSAAGQDAFAPQVAVDGAGNAIFTWARSDGSNSRIQARKRTAGGTLTAVQTLSAAGQNANSPQVAVDGAGNAIFTWARLDGSKPSFPPCCFLVQARKRSAGGALGPVQTLSAAGRNAGDPQVGIDGDGDAIFTWVRNDGSNARIQARKRTAGGALTAVQTLSAAGQSAFEPRVGVDDAGNAIITWYRSPEFIVQARRRGAGGALGATLTLSAPGGFGYTPRVAVEGDGDAVFTWDDPTESGAVLARFRSAAGALGPIRTLAPDAGSPRVAVDGAGNAVFTWLIHDGSVPQPDPCCTRVQTRTRSAGGALGPTQTISPAGQDGAASQVAVNDAGNAAATWIFRVDAASFRIQAAAGP